MHSKVYNLLYHETHREVKGFKESTLIGYPLSNMLDFSIV